MNRSLLFAALAAVVSTQASAADLQSALTAPNEASFRLAAKNDWAEIAPDVFEYRTRDGVTYQRGFGENAAAYTLGQQRNELQQMQARLNDPAAGQDRATIEDNIANLKLSISTLQARFEPLKTFATTTSGPTYDYAYQAGTFALCGWMGHQTADFYGDASLEPGGGNGAAVSSVVYVGDNVSNHVGTYTATFYVHAQAQGLGGSLVQASGTATATNSTSAGTGTLLTRRAATNSSYFSVAASTSSYVSVASCTGGFLSYSKSQTL